VASERCRYHEGHTLVHCCGLCDEPWQVFAHVPTGGEHERMNDHRACSLLDAPSEPVRNRRLGDFHVRDLHDASGAKAFRYERGDFIEQGVGLGASTAVVDQEYRPAPASLPRVCFGAAHHGYLGLPLMGVKNLDTCRQSAFHRSDIGAAEQVDVHEQRVELVERDALGCARR